MPGAPTPYEGTNPITISDTPGTSGPGVCANDGTHGRCTYPSIVDGNCDVTAGNVGAADAAEQDTLTYILWRLPDLIGGGDYRTLYRAQVSYGGSHVIDRSWAGDTTSALIVEGPTGADNWAVDIFGGGAVTTGTGRAARFTGADAATSAVDIYGGAVGATCDALSLYGGATGGRALYAQAMAGNSAAIVAIGHGSKEGLEATAGGTAGTAAILAHGGPVRVDTNIGNTSQAPGANMLWAEAIPKACGVALVTPGGTPTAVVSAGSYNAISVAAFTDSIGGGHFHSVTVTMPQAMAHATDYVVLMAPINAGAGGIYTPVGQPVDQTHFKFYVPTTYGGSTFFNIETDLGTTAFPFAVFGQQ